MAITKLEDILIPYKSPIYSAKFNQIFQSFLTDIQALENSVNTIVDYLNMKVVRGLFVEDQTDSEVILGSGEIIYNGEYHAFPDGVTVSGTLQNGQYLVYDGDTQNFVIKNPESLSDNDILLVRKVGSDLDYSIRPVLQNVSGEIYESLLYAINNEDALATGKAKAIAYILEHGRMFTYDYRNKKWRPNANIVYTEFFSVESPSGEIDQDVFEYQFVAPKFLKNIFVEITHYIDESDSITAEVKLLDGDDVKYSETLNLSGHNTQTLAIELSLLSRPIGKIIVHVSGNPSNSFAMQISAIN